MKRWAIIANSSIIRPSSWSSSHRSWKSATARSNFSQPRWRKRSSSPLSRSKLWHKLRTRWANSKRRSAPRTATWPRVVRCSSPKTMSLIGERKLLKNQRCKCSLSQLRLRRNASNRLSKSKFWLRRKTKSASYKQRLDPNSKTLPKVSSSCSNRLRRLSSDRISLLKKSSKFTPW